MNIHLPVRPIHSFFCFSRLHEEIGNLLYVSQIFSESRWIPFPNMFPPLPQLHREHRKGCDFPRGWWDTDESAVTPCPASQALATMQQMAKQQLSSKHGKHLDTECSLLVIPHGLYHLFCFLNSVVLSNLFTELYLLLTPALWDKMTFISHHECLNSFCVYTKYWKRIIGYDIWEPPGILYVEHSVLSNTELEGKL